MAAAGSIRKDIWNLPNILTMGRILVIPVVCWLAGLGPLGCVWATLLFGVAGFTDWLDGYLARKMKLESMTGKFLDPLADKLLVMAVLVTLVPLGRIPAWLVILSVGREISVNGLRALAAGEGLIIGSDWGGKWKTGFQFVGLACLLLHFQYTIDYFLFDLTVRLSHIGFILMFISLLYSLWSGWEYFRGFLRAIEARAA